ncbi:MAG: hypothetical protein R3E11_04175 [Sphingobium sp.]|nr:hypothetical protein [Sphingobium sp.]MCP5398693.1 hypothetical protein [Sphingomonas sp.]
MTDSSIWSVDHIAATNLAASLGPDCREEQIELIAEHFAQHRHSAYTWIADRIRDNLLERLSSASRGLFRRKSDEWTSGYREAEHIVMTIDTDELVGVDDRPARSKGQILRSMMRGAKK